MDFKSVDLREQVSGLVGKWYFDNYKSRTRVNKHRVVFDGDFKFILKYHPEEIQEKTEDIVLTKDIYIDGIKEMSKGEVLHFEKGEVISDEYISLELNVGNDINSVINYYNDDSKYDESTSNILENIMVYIANYI